MREEIKKIKTEQAEIAQTLIDFVGESETDNTPWVQWALAILSIAGLLKLYWSLN